MHRAEQLAAIAAAASGSAASASDDTASTPAAGSTSAPWGRRKRATSAALTAQTGSTPADELSLQAARVMSQHPLWLTFSDAAMEQRFKLYQGNQCRKVHTPASILFSFHSDVASALLAIWPCCLPGCEWCMPSVLEGSHEPPGSRIWGSVECSYLARLIGCKQLFCRPIMAYSRLFLNQPLPASHS